MEPTFMQKVFYRLKITLFYFFKRRAFKELEFGAFIARPLRILGRRYMSIGKGVTINSRSWLFALKIDGQDPSLIIQEGCAIGDDNHIAAVRKVVLGKFVLTANGVYISDNLHGYQDVNIPIMHQPVVFKGEVSIGDGTWIGEHACIIGAKVGRNCVIGANAVVTTDIPDYSVAAGAPARVIKQYNFETRAWEKVTQQ